MIVIIFLSTFIHINYLFILISDPILTGAVSTLGVPKGMTPLSLSHFVLISSIIKE